MKHLLLILGLVMIAFSSKAQAQQKQDVNLNEIRGIVVNGQEFFIDVYGAGFVKGERDKNKPGTDIVMLGGSYCKQSRDACRVNNWDFAGNQTSSQMLQIPITVGEPADDLRLIAISPDGTESRAIYIKEIKPPKRQ